MNDNIPGSFFAGQKVRPSQLGGLYLVTEKLRAEELNRDFASGGDGPGPGPDPGVGTAANPGEALWIGPVDGKNHFNIGIGGPGGGTDHTDHDEADIESGFSQDPEFMLTAEGNVHFEIGVDAGRTSEGTNYPRTELRELKEDQGAAEDRAGWDGNTGAHYMRARSRVMHVAATKPWVVIFQIHDSSSDLIRVQTEDGGSGPEGLRLRARYTKPGDSEATVTILDSYALGDWLDWEIRIDDGTCTIDIDGTQVFSETGMGTTGCYFKSGCYAQSNTDTEGGDSSQFFVVEMEAGSLECWHTGYATPTDPVFTGGDGVGGDDPDLTTAAGTQGWGTPLPSSDEFDYVGAPDPTKWSLPGPDWAGHNGNGTRDPERVTVDGTKLIMTGLANGSTGWMQHTLDQEGGRWEARVRSFQNATSNGNDYHALLLIWPESNSRSTDGEYDYMELGIPGQGSLEAFMHYPNDIEGDPAGTQQEHFELAAVDMSAFHNVAFEYQRGSGGFVRGFLDGVEWFSHTGGGGPNERRDIQDMPAGHMTIQLDNFDGTDQTPATIEVEWVRVYPPP